MKKEIIKLTESDLHNIVKEAVNEIINEMNIISYGDLTKVYWKCEFENGSAKKCKMIYARSKPESVRRAFEMGLRIGMKPKYETLRNATMQEIEKFQEQIRRKARENSIQNK
jgi:hypothetical protein